MNTSIKVVLAVCASVSLGACGGGIGLSDKADKTVDRGFDSKPLTDLSAGIWVDPNGSQHWIIDDGVEGYLSQRLKRDGKPNCSEQYEKTTVTGPYNESGFGDLI